MNEGVIIDDSEPMIIHKPTITWLQFVLLELLMLSPVLWVIVFFWQLHSPLGAQLAFQLTTLSTLPIIYTRIVLQLPLKQLFQCNIEQLKYGIPLMLLSLTSTGLTCYIICEFTSVINFELLHVLKSNTISMVIACLLLVFTNPFLEEFFWRSFLSQAFTHCNYFQYNESLKWYLSFHYALYHFFVLYQFTYYIWIAILGFLVITVAGRVFFLTKDHIGLLAASLFHMGADLAIVIVAIYYAYPR